MGGQEVWLESVAMPSATISFQGDLFCIAKCQGPKVWLQCGQIPSLFDVLQKKREVEHEDDTRLQVLLHPLLIRVQYVLPHTFSRA